MTEQTTKFKEAEGVVRKYMLATAGAGLMPLPLVDLVAVSGLQLAMLNSLAKLYRIEFSEELGKSVIASLVGGGLPLPLSTALASLLRGVPLLGPAVGFMGVALFAGASTYALGRVFIQHFESGGTFLTFDPEKVRDFYNQKVDEGKQEVGKSFAGVKP